MRNSQINNICQVITVQKFIRVTLQQGMNYSRHTSRTCNQTKIRCRSDRRNKLLPSWDRRHSHHWRLETVTVTCMASSAHFDGDLRTCWTCRARCHIISSVQSKFSRENKCWIWPDM